MALSTIEKINRLSTDSDLLHDVVHGGPGESVQTEGGAVPTIAKAVADAEARMQAEIDILHEVTQGDATTVVQTASGPVDSMAKAITSLRAFNFRGDWAAGMQLNVKDVVAFAALAYVSTQAGAFVSNDINADIVAGRLVIHQGATREELAASGGSTLIGYLPDGENGAPLTVHAKLAQSIDLDDYDTFIAACNESIVKGRYVRLAGRNFNIPAGTVIPGGADVRGVHGQTRVTVVGNGALLFGGDRVSLRNIDFSGGTYALNTNGKVRNRIVRCGVTGTAMHGIYCDSSRNLFERCVLEGCGLTGIALYGPNAYRNQLIGNEGSGNGSFVLWVAAGANRNELQGNTTEGGNAAELIGVTYDSWANRIIGNHAQDTLDNGISVTGYRNVVIGNTCMLNANHGIGIYGERNTVVGNTCLNNGQANLTASVQQYAGITMTPAFGGLARKNIVHGNTCDDNQAVKTQQWGLKVTTNAHIQWTAGMPVDAGRAFCFNGLIVYHTNDTGIAGNAPPVHREGTVSDGAISWTVVASNRWTLSDHPAYWTSGDNVRAGAFQRYGNNVYQAAGAGVTGATPPTHLLGTASDGGVSWIFVEQYPNNLDGWDNEIGSNQANGNALGPWSVQTSNPQRIKHTGMLRNSVDGRLLTTDIIPLARNPEGAVTASPGAIAQRLDTSTTPGIALFSKQSGTGNIGWLPVALRHQGLLANRPDLSPLGKGVRGYKYYATDLTDFGRELTWHGTGWIDPVTGQTYTPV
ncbi:right-handed parallel beta-helix repeat-containing protein [Paraburkholderia sp. SARCC-3016]|uniref:right-handed parallel beta-helix repeat-containing protein n=1 Tax=Paraburkholderia sp. SARCC-3016 TaxID=3058611 RepID=UPI002809D45E|nr:right-handed parallel beta-helix repeat-containing protein [Paraburkholderia sp. SARCC-3016]MDQ7981344.1 right-handed parallel beta-helix repeat-containing protein [Paraburkholderia sp. SARCC-3016]